MEDTASTAFEFLLDQTADPQKLPEQVLKKVAKWVREDKHELKVWSLAGDGWRKVLRQYRETMLHTYVSFFNTPKARNVDDLFEAMLGMPALSDNWTWINMSAQKAKDRLAAYIELRGAIAHRVKSSQTVYKKTVIDYRVFITRLAVRTANVTRKYIHDLTGQRPWDQYVYGSFE